MAMTILGISPGTRLVGLGLIQNDELAEWQVKTFKGSWSKEKLNLIIEVIESLCDHYQVTDLALKVVSPLRSSKNLLILTNRITEMAEKHKIRISRFTVQDLRLKIGLHGKRSVRRQHKVDFWGHYLMWSSSSSLIEFFGGIATKIVV